MELFYDVGQLGWKVYRLQSPCRRTLLLLRLWETDLLRNLPNYLWGSYHLLLRLLLLRLLLDPKWKTGHAETTKALLLLNAVYIETVRWCLLCYKRSVRIKLWYGLCLSRCGYSKA